MIIELVILVCLIIGLLFSLLGVLGLIKFPDVYTRLHAETKATTFGILFIGLAIILYALFIWSDSAEGISLAAHTLIAVVVLMITNATGSHAIARAAYISGQKPDPSVTDKLKDVEL